MNDYLPRVMDKILEKRLKLYGAVLISGPKWCGKSTTAKKMAASKVELQDPLNKDTYLQLAKNNPSKLLEGEKPRLIDEWQDAPELWNAIRYSVDSTGLKNQYILTGSITPKETDEQNQVKRHSGIGRIVRLIMRPMSLFESLESNGSVSLTNLFEENLDISGISDKTHEDIAFYCARGGWPSMTQIPREDALVMANDYYESIINNEINLPDARIRNPRRVDSVLKSLSRNICSTASIDTIKLDTSFNDREINEKTIIDYIDALEKLYIIDNIDAWNERIRSKTVLRTSPKRNFVDPSIAMASLKISDKDLLKDYNTFGFIFESLCIRDLKIYSEYLNGHVFYYRDKSDLECDAIIHLNNGKWGAIEIKIGSQEGIEEAATNLKKLVSKQDNKDLKKPSFLMVLTAGKIAYKREEGVLVVPITCLKY